jgi:hypothetical protein
VADAVQVEPVSTVKFPANREINNQQNREFLAKNKEFARENREFEDVIVDRDP